MVETDSCASGCVVVQNLAGHSGIDGVSPAVGQNPVCVCVCVCVYVCVKVSQTVLY